MTDLVDIKKIPKKAKIMILEKLGFGSDGIFVLDKNGEKHLDKYTKEKIKLDNMFIYPGSTIILDNNPVSISSFFEEYGDVFER